MLPSDTSATTSTPNWDTLTQETTGFLQALLRFNTTNPPGNEAPAIQYIAEQLRSEGIEPTIVESAPGRANLWARLPGNGSKRPLMLLSHVDVVPVERDLWSVDPFGGEIHNGYVYGRGAVDMKSMTAKQLALMFQFAREARTQGRPLDRDLILLTVADEEQQGTYGAQWLIKNRPDLTEAEYALNEGGGFALQVGNRRIYVCETAQKGSAHILLTAKGDPGHASVPHQNNAIVRLAHATTRLAAAPLPLHATTTMREMVANLTTAFDQPLRSLIPAILNPLLSEGILQAFPDKNTANALRAMLHNTATPTILEAGQALNVIPSEATLQLDCRVIPGQTAASVRDEIRRRIGDPHIEVEVDLNSPGHESSSKTELFSAISGAIATHDPGAMVTPYLLPAVTDSRFIVPRGVTSYGFDPMQPEPGWPLPQQMAHSHDERISVANLNFGLRVLYDTISAIGR